MRQSERRSPTTVFVLEIKPNVERATTRYRDFIKWKTSNPGMVDDTLPVFKDPELERCLLSEVVVFAPCLKTKQGGPLLIDRFRNNDISDGRTADDVCRMLFYTIDRVMQRPETQLHGITIVRDLRNFNKSKNVLLEIDKHLFHGLIGQFPIHIKTIYADVRDDLANETLLIGDDITIPKCCHAGLSTMRNRESVTYWRFDSL